MCIVCVCIVCVYVCVYCVCIVCVYVCVCVCVCVYCMCICEGLSPTYASATIQLTRLGDSLPFDFISLGLYQYTAPHHIYSEMLTHKRHCHTHNRDCHAHKVPLQRKGQLLCRASEACAQRTHTGEFP